MLTLIHPEETTTMATKRITPEAGGFAAFVDDQRIGWRAVEADARELASEYIYDAEQSGALYCPAAPEKVVAVAPAGAVRTVPAYRLPNGDLTSDPIGPLAFVDFEIGDGATKVSLGPREGYPGLDLIIGGRMINTRVTEIITLADLRQLRDNLTALLADERAVAALDETIEPPPPTPVAPADEAPITPNKYDTGEYSMHWMHVFTPLATLSNGLTVMGTHDVDGSPNCAYYNAPDGHFYVGPNGHLSGTWGGMDLEIEPEALPKLCALFTSNIPSTLQDIAHLWAGDESTPERPESRCTHLRVAFKILAEIERVAKQSLTRQRFDQLTSTIAKLVDDEFGIVDFEDLPALTAVCVRREAGAPPSPVQKAA